MMKAILAIISPFLICGLMTIVHAQPVEVHNGGELKVHIYVDDEDRGRLDMWGNTPSGRRGDGPYIQLYNREDLVKLRAHVDPAGHGTLFLYGSGNPCPCRRFDPGDPCRGPRLQLRALDSTRNPELRARSRNPHDLIRVRLGSHDCTDNAYLYLHDGNGRVKFRAYVNREDQGEVNIYGGGYLSLHDSAGSRTISLDGESGIISKTGMNGFLIPHPKDTSKEIFYASMEGPEAGLYTRGTARLNDGRAIVHLPEHFSAVANLEGMTVQLTPTSADTYGLAVIKKTQEAFIVQELAGGKGNFSFDYVIFAARGDIPAIEPVRTRNEKSSSNDFTFVTKDGPDQ